MDNEEIKRVVRKSYAEVAKQDHPRVIPLRSCCGGGASLAQEISKNIGYTEKDLAVAPEGANLGLGCGNPVALASLQEGDIVLYLGAGAGFDCFLAAQRVGVNGRVIGVDMAPEMVEKARENARKGNYRNVEFRLLDKGVNLTPFDAKNRLIFFRIFDVEMYSESNVRVPSSSNTLCCFPPFALVMFTI